MKSQRTKIYSTAEKPENYFKICGIFKPEFITPYVYIRISFAK